MQYNLGGGNPLEEMSAMDLEGRVIYGLDATIPRLYRYNMDTRDMVSLGNITTMPARPDRIGITPFVWDPINRVLLMFDLPGNGGGRDFTYLSSGCALNGKLVDLPRPRTAPR